MNLINQRFGKLIVINKTNKRKNNSIIWQCKCDCGNIEYLSTKELRNDGIIQCHRCGKTRMPNKNLLIDIIGKKFNHLTVIKKTSKRRSGKILYLCKCDCGSNKDILTTRTELIKNHTTSCGCCMNKYSVGDVVNNRKIIGFQKNEENGRLYYKCICLYCNKEYFALGQTLEKSISCGCLKNSIGEMNVANILKEYNILNIKEYVFPSTKYRFDFAILDKNTEKIIRLIEFDGELHYLENIKNKGWNTLEKYKKTKYNDNQKNKLAKEKGIPLVRIPYWERENIDLNMIFGDKYLIN